MEKKHKLYLRLNIMSLAFIVISFISVTLAWFAYSGLSSVSTEIGVKAWYIELDKDGQPVSNDIVISLSDIYPGMNIVDELVNIKNLGDSDAQLSYSIVSARILGDEADNYVINDTTTTSEYVEDVLSHDYPFHININLSKNYILAKGEESSFEVSVSWPLDSGIDSLDSLWGTEAYKFEQSELAKKNSDANYQIKPSIQIVISVKAEQYIESDTTSDPNYDLGDVVLYDVVNNQVCTEISTTCLTTYVIDKNNTLGDDTVTLLPNVKNTYLSSSFNDYNATLSSITSGWTVGTRPLTVEDLLKITSNDVIGSTLSRDNISDLIIGKLTYNNRMSTEIAKAVSSNGHYNFANLKFDYLSSANCYWTSSEYNTTNAFATAKTGELSSKIYGEAKTASCNVVPVIIAPKTNL